MTEHELREALQQERADKDLLTENIIDLINKLPEDNWIYQALVISLNEIGIYEW